MILTIVNVVYVLLAVALIVLVLLQRGAGATAGAGFGGGASGTVFGARGTMSFMFKLTGVLAFLFIAISLGMGVHAARTGIVNPAADLGVLAELEAPSEAAPATDVPVAVDLAAPAETAEVPVAPVEEGSQDESPAPTKAEDPKKE